MQKTSNRLYAALLCLICAFALCPIKAYAAGAIDLSKNVDLTISYQNNGAAVEGVPFELYYAADVDAYGEFTLAGDFADYPVDVNDLSSDEWKVLADTLKSYVDRDGLQPLDQGKTDADGILRFPCQQSEMKPGLYLAIGRTYTNGGYVYTTEPFMIALPNLDKETDSWLYSVNATPKYTRDDVPPNPDDQTVSRKVLKVWKDSNSQAQRPKEIVVQLLKNGAVYDSVTLNADNDWRHTWNDLPKFEENRLIDWQVAEKEVKNYSVKVTQEGTTFLVTNTYKPTNNVPVKPTPNKPTKLPQTGMLWWPVPVLVVCGIIFLIGSRLVKKKKRNE